MAFLSDIHLPAKNDSQHSTWVTQPRVNWRLMLALSVNLVVWTTGLQILRSLF